MQPQDLANRALDAIGVRGNIGDLQEGGIAAVVLRHYGPCMRQMFRSAHWNFARKQASLTLLQDATGQTTAAQIAAGMVATVGTGTVGMLPWLYEYAWPVDCVKARFVPLTPSGPNVGVPSGNIALPQIPLYGGQSGGQFIRQIPTRFVVGQDSIPNLIGVPATWGEIPDTSQTMGQGLVNQTVILSNQLSATMVYTALLTYPDQWDPLFQHAFVALLASHVAMALIPDRAAALRSRDEQIKVAKMALDQARVTDGDEGWFSVDHQPDWLRARNSGGGYRAAGGEIGTLGYGWDACSFGDGSAY